MRVLLKQRLIPLAAKYWSSSVDFFRPAQTHNNWT